MTPRLRTVVAVVAALIVAAGIGRVVMTRRAATAPPPAALPASAPMALDLAETDVVRAVRTSLKVTLPLSGSLLATRSALVKAKVAAEVRSIEVREGDAVTAGQLLGRLDDTEFQWRLRQSDEQAAAAQAQLQIAERTLANNQALVDQGFISKTALETSVSSAAGARASLLAAQAASELAHKALRDTEVRAPLAGLVSQRFVQPGERVGVDARLVEIVDLSRFEFEAAVAPEHVVALRVGQQARLRVDGLAQPLPAEVVRINPSAQSGTRSVMAYLKVSSVAGLRHGLFAQGEVELQNRPALVVPVGAVRNDQARPYVLAVSDGVAQQRVVTLGERGDVDLGRGSEPGVEVLDGLEAGSIVLRGTVGGLRAGTRLRLPAAGTPATAATAAMASSPSNGAAASAAPSGR